MTLARLLMPPSGGAPVAGVTAPGYAHGPLINSNPKHNPPMNHSRMFATVVSGLTLLAMGAFAQQGGGSSSSSSSNATPSSSQQRPASSPSMTTPATPSSTTTTTTPSETTTVRSSGSSRDATTQYTTSGVANSSNANANANLNAGAGFYGPGASQFKTIDSDADGRISRAEFTTSASLDLNLDANRDGIVSTEERAAAPDKKGTWTQRSNDGTPDMNPAETFAKLDADNDGFLSQNELASANAKLKK
jgi:hypothetical protein